MVYSEKYRLVGRFLRINFKNVQYWHCGNQLQKICLMKQFRSVDVSFLGDSARIRLNEEVKQLMEIDEIASPNGAEPSKKKMNMSSIVSLILFSSVEKLDLRFLLQLLLEEREI